MESSCRVPLFIGVTAHRRFRALNNEGELKLLRAAIKRVINQIRGRNRHTEFILLTSLAAGGDQLVAEVAIDMDMRYGAVLPMDVDKFLDRVDEYGPNFTEEEKKNARRLMDDKHCAFVYVMPPEGDGDEAQFRAAARFVSDNSCAVIALWDGILDNDSMAGTGVAVRDSLHGKRYHAHSFSGITVPETRPIYHIYTPRDGGDFPSLRGKEYCIRKLFPEPLLETGDSWFRLNRDSDDPEEDLRKKFSDESSAKKEGREGRFHEYLRHIDKYNSRIIRWEENEEKKSSKPGKEKKKKYVDDSPKISDMGERGEFCEKHYNAADALAMMMQQRRKRCGTAIILAAGIGYALLSISSDLYEHPLLLAGFFLALILAVVIHFVVNKRMVHESFVNYRAIAEALRVQQYWHCADIRGRDGLPAQAQDYYLRRQKGQIEWVRYVIRSVNLMTITCYERTQVDAGKVKEVADAWLGKMDVRNEKAKKRSERWVHPTNNLKGNGQSGYFLGSSIKSRKEVVAKEGAYKKSFRMSKQYKSFLWLRAFMVSFIAASLLLVFAYFLGEYILSYFLPGNAYSGFVMNYGSLMLAASAILPVAAMVFKEISDYMGYEEDVKRYAWYHKVFKRAIIEIDEIWRCRRNDDVKRKEMQLKLFEIGEEALIENADWVMINANRAPEVPTN